MAIKSNQMEPFFGDVLVPVQEVTEMKNGKRVTTKRKFLPGYVLVEMVMNKETHHFINNIPGVTRLHRRHAAEAAARRQGRGRPDPRPHLRARGGQGAVVEIPYKVGESVQVMDGPVQRVDRRGERDQPREGQAEGDDLDFRQGDSGRAGLPSGEAGLARRCSAARGFCLGPRGATAGAPLSAADVHRDGTRPSRLGLGPGRQGAAGGGLSAARCPAG